MQTIPRVVVAGTNSGVGKTTIVAGILAALRQKGYRVQPFKVGPDYIDPGFHSLAAGRDCLNLDMWLVPKTELAPFFVDVTQDVDIAIIEGVMGLYDGGRQGISSTAEIAKSLKAPVLLVIDCKAMGASAAAIAQGFRDYDKEVNLAGVILNRIGSDTHEAMIRKAMEAIGMPVLAVIRRNDQLHSPERHLGLTPVTEVDPKTMIATIAAIVNQQMDWTMFLQLAKAAPSLPPKVNKRIKKDKRVTIAVAKDQAFSFYYPASLEALEEAGADLVYFSPIADKVLPKADALFIGGGFPEMFLGQLAANVTMRASIKKAVEEGLPTYAECGGYMYLSQAIVDFEGQSYPMVGLIPAKSQMEKKLQRVGYVTATALRDTLLAPKGTALKGHEFHFSTMHRESSLASNGSKVDKGSKPMTAPPEKKETSASKLEEADKVLKDISWQPAFSLQGTRQTQSHEGGITYKNVLASYLHINFAGLPEAVERFIGAAETYKKMKNR